MVMLVLGGTAPLAGQDDPRVALNLNYQGGVRPGVVVLAGPGLDSVRRVVERDLQYSDRFEMAFLPAGTPPIGDSLNMGVYSQVGLTWAVELQPIPGGLAASLHNLRTGERRLRVLRTIDPAATGDGRMAIHRLADTLTLVASGGRGIAATRVLFVLGDGVWSIDSDGANLHRVSRGLGLAMSPTWSPDGSRIAYTEIRDYGGPIILQNLATGARQTVPSSNRAGMAITPAFSPDGREMIFAQTSEAGTDLWRVDIARMCCAAQLSTGGKLADNMSPTYSPDGRKVAFISTRPGRPQIYVMDADGADQRALVQYSLDTGPSDAPDWSPDGLKVAFHRDIAGGRQVMVFEFGTGRATAVTSTGRNEDPRWAPDSRHVVYKSNRSGGEQLWVLDTETGALRQLTNVNGKARMPAWSGPIAGNNP
jgi:TolB protein